MLKKFINWYFEFLKKWYLVVFIVFLGLSGYLGYLGTKIEMRSDFIDLLSDKNKVMQNMRKVFQIFGGEGYLICTLELKHPFYGMDEDYRLMDDRWNALKEQVSKWDPFDTASTEKYLPGILYHLTITRDFIESRLKTKFLAISAKMTDAKAKKYIPEFLKTIQQTIDGLNSIIQKLTLPANQNPQGADAMLRNLYKLLNTTEPDKAFDYINKGIQDADTQIHQIKETIKSVFINHTAIERAADKIASTIQSQNLPEVKFVSYRKPVKWMKDNFFYLIEYQDLVGLKNELNKIHLSAFRVLGSDKFQGIRNILNKYSVNIGGDDAEDNTNQSPSANAPANTSNVNPAAPGSSPTMKNEYEYRFNSFKDMLLILIKPSGRSSDLDYSRQFITKITKIIRDSHPNQFDPRIEYGLTGRYVKKVEDADVLSKDIKYTSIIAVLLIVVVIFLYFRRIRAIFATMIPLFTGLMWALGIVYIAVGYFNIITGFIVAILSGLGIDFGIHMLARYYEERKEGKDVIDSLKRVFDTTLKATFTAASTTAFAFLCLVVTEFKGFAQFGYTIFLGLMFIIVAMFITFPCILIISEKINPVKLEKLKKGKEESLAKLRGRKYPFPYTVAGASLLLIIISLFFKPQFNFDFSQLRSTEGSFAQKIAALKTRPQPQGTVQQGQNQPANPNPTGVSSEGSDALEARIGESFRVSLWPSIAYTTDMRTASVLTNSLIRRSHYTNDIIRLTNEGHFMNFIKKIYNQPDFFSPDKLSPAVLNYFAKMKNDVVLDMLSKYFKSMNAANYHAEMATKFVTAIKRKIRLNSVSQYIENVYRNLMGTAADTGSANQSRVQAEENEENFSLDVPTEARTETRLSATDKKNLEAFFDSVLQTGIDGLKKYISQPYDYIKILSKHREWLKLLNNAKAEEALGALYNKIKNSVSLKIEALKFLVDSKKDFLRFEDFQPVQKYLVEILNDGYNSFEIYDRMGLSEEYNNMTDYLTTQKQIRLENEIDGDLYLALKTPYNFRNIMESLRIVFNEIDSVTRYVPDDQAERKKLIREINDILTDNKFIKKVKDKKDQNMIKEAKNACKNTAGVKYSDLPEEISSRFNNQNDNSGTLIFIYPTTGASMSDEVSIQAYSRYLASLKSPFGHPIMYASETVIFADILTIIKKDGWLIILLTMISIIALLLLDFKTLKSLLFTNIPLLGGVALMFLVMRIFNVKINYLNAAVLPVILGVGIDEGVHIYHRYIEEGQKNLWFIIRTTGFAVFMADFTTAIGFTALMFANYRGLRTMGHLAVIGIMTAFFVSITLLPALLQIMENRRNKKALN